MPLSFLEGAEGSVVYADAAGAIPGLFLSTQDFASAKAALEFLAEQAGASGGLIPVSAGSPAADPLANLWFIRAAHLFGKMGGDAATAAKLLQVSKRILQAFIGGSVGGVKMDDGGLLIAESQELAARGLRLNALWYSAMESTAADLKAAGDKGGDHFERLAGRFRRAFAKSYWCDGHNCVCPPYRRASDSHGDIPDAEQLLLTILPASPIPRTKQRQLLQLVKSKLAASKDIGLLIDDPVMGRVESLMHRGWLAVGILNSADNRATVAAEAAEVVGPLDRATSAEAGGGPALYYKDGKAVGGRDPLATAEIDGAIRQARA